MCLSLDTCSTSVDLTISSRAESVPSLGYVFEMLRLPFTLGLQILHLLCVEGHYIMFVFNRELPYVEWMQ